MLAVRRLLLHRRLVTLVCAAALLLKLLVPTGYMVATDHGHLAITICSGVANDSGTMSMAGMQGRMPDHGGKDHGKAEMPCAFSGLSAQALAAVDPILLVALVAFIMALGLQAATTAAPSSRTYLRPPLRGPPATL